MSQVIIYETDTGGVAIVIPAPECALSMSELAASVVPHGAARRIVDRASIPTDRANRNDWTYAEISGGIPA